MGKFEITKRKDGEFQFNLKAGNGQVILTSEGDANKSGCLNGIESVRKNAPTAEISDISWFFCPVFPTTSGTSAIGIQDFFFLTSVRQYSYSTNKYEADVLVINMYRFMNKKYMTIRQARAQPDKSKLE